MRRRDGHASRRTAFTVIELLVVIGIIATLIALLLPTMAAARDRATQIKCATQLRQLGQGLANYAAVFRGSYPVCGNWHVYGGDGTGEDEPGPGWTEQLEPYFAKVLSGVYRCPAFPPETEINYFLGIRWLVQQGRFDLKTSDIRYTSEFILSGDCTHARLYPPPWGQAQLFLYTNDCDKDDARWKCLSFFGEEYGWNAHARGGNNVLFGDYHVAGVTRFDPQSMTYHPKRLGQDFDQIVSEDEQ